MSNDLQASFKILVQTVGTGGENNPVWEALAFTIRKRQPDLVVWCCSEKTATHTVLKIREELGESLPARSDVHICSDWDNVEKLYDEYAQLIDRLRQLHPLATIEVDYTSGTKAMSASLAIAAVSRVVHQAHYAVGPRDESGRATRTEKLVTLTLDVPVVDHRLRELGRQFDLGQFDAVLSELDLLEQRVQDPRQRHRWKSLRKLAEAYKEWDRFAWNSATSLMQHIDRKDFVQQSGWDTSQLARQSKHVRTCSNTWDSPERLVDLLANAERCLKNGRFDDAVSRLYRLVEYVGQVRFAARFEFAKKSTNPTKSVPFEGLRNACPILAGEIERRGRVFNGKVDLALRDTITSLAEAGDIVGQTLKAAYDPPDLTRPWDKGPLGKQLDARNESLLAHGVTPVAEVVAQNLFTSVSGLVSDHLRELGKTLEEQLPAATFHKCPWS